MEVKLLRAKALEDFVGGGWVMRVGVGGSTLMLLVELVVRSRAFMMILDASWSSCSMVSELVLDLLLETGKFDIPKEFLVTGMHKRWILFCKLPNNP